MSDNGYNDEEYAHLLKTKYFSDENRKSFMYDIESSDCPVVRAFARRPGGNVFISPSRVI